MYPRTSTGGLPVWQTILIGMVLVISIYMVWNGVMAYFNARGDITAPATARAANDATQTHQLAIELTTPTPLPTATATRPCQMFKVRGPHTIVHECAKLTCATLSTILQADQEVCVYGVEPAATDWYIVNLDPASIYPHLTYVHKSVLYSPNPTPPPSRTPTHVSGATVVPTLQGLSTVTPTAVR